MALHLEIVTPKGSVLAAEADEVVLPGKIGEFAVLEGHIPLLSALKPGVVRISVEQKETQLAIGSGFAEVGAGDRVLVTTSRHAFPDDIDVEEVRHELSEAEDAIKLWTGEVHELDPETDQWKETADYKALRRKVEWAQARLQAAR